MGVFEKEAKYVAGFLPYPCNGSSSVDAHLDLKASGRIMWHLENIAFPFHLNRLNLMILLKMPYEFKSFPMIKTSPNHRECSRRWSG